MVPYVSPGSSELYCTVVVQMAEILTDSLIYDIPTNIGIVRGTVSVATIVLVNAGVEIWLL